MTDEERRLLDYIADNFDTDRIERDGVFVRTRSSGGGQHKGDVAGTINIRGYNKICMVGKIYGAHRIVYLWVNKQLPKDQIDHINHKRKDNSPSNLREATNTTNQRNRTLSKNNKSGYTGVCFRKNRMRWIGSVGNGVKKNRKSFKSKQDAIDFVKAKRAEFGYHENHGKPNTTEVIQCEV
jgi:hypothetical protein